MLHAFSRPPVQTRRADPGLTPGNEGTPGWKRHEELLYLYLYARGLTTAAMETQEDSIDIVKLKRVALGQVSSGFCGVSRFMIVGRAGLTTHHYHSLTGFSASPEQSSGHPRRLTETIPEGRRTETSSSFTCWPGGACPECHPYYWYYDESDKCEPTESSTQTNKGENGIFGGCAVRHSGCVSIGV